MMAQVATYARAQMISRKNRLWTFCITVNHRTGEFRFNFFHRGGLASTRIMSLKNKDGFRAFAHMVSYIMVKKNAFEAGFDPTRNDTCFNIPHLGRFRFQEDLCYRTTLCGRSTEVVRLGRDGQQHDPGEKHLLLCIEPIAIHNPQRRSPSGHPGAHKLVTKRKSGSQDAHSSSKKSKHASGDHVKPSTPIGDQNEPAISSADGSKLDGSDKLAKVKKIVRTDDATSNLEEHLAAHLESINMDPEYQNKETVTFKDLWPYESRKMNEVEMFRDTNGEYGIPTVILAYEAFYEIRGDHTFPALDGQTYFPAFGEDVPTSTPNYKPRAHMRTIVATVGERLEHAEGPQALFRALSHAMIGTSSMCVWYGDLNFPQDI
jgi:hypothetical protein